MSYRLEDGEALHTGFRRCAREQLDSAIKELTDGVKADPVKAVHEVRKSLKKERSLLRLARGSLDKRERRRENATFREAARSLSITRDADAIVQALDDLSERYAGQVPKATFAAIRKPLNVQRTNARLQLIEADLTAAVIEELSSASLRVDDWRLRRDGWAAIGEGLLRSYRRGRKAFKRSHSAPTAENLHEWRKRCKDLWYHFRLLRQLSPHTMKGHAEDAHHLSDLLGEDHDLAVLREATLALVNEITADSEPVIGLIDHRRAELQTEALFLGDRLYAERPKAFVRRIHRYWKAWREQARAAGPDPIELAEATRHAAVA